MARWEDQRPYPAAPSRKAVVSAGIVVIGCLLLVALLAWGGGL